MAGKLVLVLLLVGASARLLHGQTASGDIAGRVTDSTGGILPGVQLRVTNQATGQQRLLITDSGGNYLVTALPAGVYTIKAELTDFKTQTRSDITLQVGRLAQVDFVLEVGSVSEEITIEEPAPPLQTSNAEVSEVIDNARVNSLPLNGRQFVDLSLLSDNVLVAPRGTRGSALAQTGPAVLVAGQRPGHNMYYLDGVSVTDQYFNHLSASPPPDVIQEFNIQKSIYPAEFGGKASATISAVTKSGANAFHGSVYEFLRNDVFDARNFFDPEQKPPYRQNQFGATSGGPLKRNSTFYFLGYEGRRVRQSLTQRFSVPSIKTRNGDFSGLAAIYDPSTTVAAGNRQPFQGNSIPKERLDPAALAFIQKLPLPNLPGEIQNYIATPVLRSDDDQASVRLDHHLKQSDTLFTRLYLANFDTVQPFGSSLLNETLVPGFGYSLTTRTTNIALGETHVFRPNVVSELRFGFLRVSGGQQGENRRYDFAARNAVQGIAPAPDQTGYPSMNFSGAYTTAGDPPNLFTRRNNSFDFLENVSWIRGSHSLKFGTYVFRLQFNPSESPNARGSFTFTPRYTSSAAGLADGNAFADFLLGYPTAAQAGIGPGGREYGRSLWTHFYAQDDWKLNRVLTFNYGLRYEVNGQVTDTQDRLSNIELNRFVVASDSQGRLSPFADTLLPLIPIPVVSSKDAGYDRSLQLPNYHHIAPRIGLAWALWDKTVLRAGWGLFFNQASYNIQTALTENLPFYFNKSVNTASTTLTPTLEIKDILLSSPGGAVGGSGLNYKYRSEFADSWNLNIQRLIGSGIVVQASYFGSHVSGADNSTFENVPIPGPGAIDPRRPNPLLSGFKMIRWDGYSLYHSGTLKIEKRLSRGLTVNANYTWSKSIDDASDVGTTFAETNIPQDVRNVGAEKALSSFDHRHRFVFSYSYELPFRNPRKVLQGWTLTGLGSFQSGAPFTVILPNDNANIGTGPAQRPNLIGDPNKHAPHTAEQWFNTVVFQMPAPFTFGSAGRNVVFGAGESNVDLSLIKETIFKEDARLQFRCEVFNVLNHTNFADSPGRIAFTSTFGRYTSAENPRQIQFALKLLF
jgi:carboxypeptidase family protein/TonB-dependent receptor-like protein